MLVDDVRISVQAGAGGKGKVAFQKTVMSLGPTGGNGGHGGNVYFEGVSNLDVLKQFRYKKNIEAKNGHDGRDQFRDGHDGEDLVVPVPVGTVVHDLTNNRDIEITHIGERALIAEGGLGGKGNFLFRSSRNTTPTQAQGGLPGTFCELHLELKLIADVGLIGYPNVGKSSLLNELTGAKSRVANYQFTTLEPHLGAYQELIIADIPGLIEGASHGKGLGTKFLRHIERTKILFHLVSAESPDPKKDYNAIREELQTHNKALLKKPEFVFLSKYDAVDLKEAKKKLSALKKLNKNAFLLSIADDDTLTTVKKILAKVLTDKGAH